MAAANTSRASAIATAQQTYDNTVSASQATYNTAVAAADATFKSQISSGNLFSGDAPVYQWQSAPEVDRFKIPDDSTQPKPPVEPPKYDGDTPDLEKDQVYQDAAKAAKDQFDTDSAAAATTKNNSDTTAKNAADTATTNAENTYKDSVNAAAKARDEILQQQTDSLASLNAAREAYEATRAAIYTAYVRELQRIDAWRTTKYLAEREPMYAKESVAFNAYTIAINQPLAAYATAYQQLGQTCSAIQSLGHAWSAVELAAMQAREQTGYSLMANADRVFSATDLQARKEIANAKEGFLKALATAAQTFDIAVADSDQSMMRNNAAIYKTYDLAVALAIKVRDKAIADAEYVRVKKVADNQKAYAEKVRDLEKKRDEKLADLEHGVVHTWADANQTSTPAWLAYQKQIADGKKSDSYAKIAARVTFSTKLIDADYTRDYALAEANHNFYDGSTTTSNGIAVVSLGTIKLEYDNRVDIAEALFNYREAYAHRQYDYDVLTSLRRYTVREQVAKNEATFLTGQAKAVSDHESSVITAWEAYGSALVSSIILQLPNHCGPSGDFNGAFYYSELYGTVSPTGGISIYSWGNRILPKAASASAWGTTFTSIDNRFAGFTDTVISNRASRFEGDQDAWYNYQESLARDEQWLKEGDIERLQEYRDDVSTADEKLARLMVQAGGERDTAIALAVKINDKAASAATYDEAKADNLLDKARDVADTEDYQNYRKAEVAAYVTAINTWNTSTATAWSAYKASLAANEKTAIDAIALAEIAAAPQFATSQWNYADKQAELARDQSDAESDRVYEDAEKHAEFLTDYAKNLGPAKLTNAKAQSKAIAKHDKDVLAVEYDRRVNDADAYRDWQVGSSQADASMEHGINNAWKIYVLSTIPARVTFLTTDDPVPMYTAIAGASVQFDADVHAAWGTTRTAKSVLVHDRVLYELKSEPEDHFKLAEIEKTFVKDRWDALDTLSTKTLAEDTSLANKQKDQAIASGSASAAAWAKRSSDDREAEVTHLKADMPTSKTLGLDTLDADIAQRKASNAARGTYEAALFVQHSNKVQSEVLSSQPITVYAAAFASAETARNESLRQAKVVYQNSKGAAERVQWIANTDLEQASTKKQIDLKTAEIVAFAESGKEADISYLSAEAKLVAARAIATSSHTKSINTDEGKYWRDAADAELKAASRYNVAGDTYANNVADVEKAYFIGSTNGWVTVAPPAGLLYGGAVQPGPMFSNPYTDGTIYFFSGNINRFGDGFYATPAAFAYHVDATPVNYDGATPSVIAARNDGLASAFQTWDAATHPIPRDYLVDIGDADIRRSTSMGDDGKTMADAFGVADKDFAKALADASKLQVETDQDAIIAFENASLAESNTLSVAQAQTNITLVTSIQDAEVVFRAADGTATVAMDTSLATGETIYNKSVAQAKIPPTGTDNATKYNNLARTAEYDWIVLVSSAHVAHSTSLAQANASQGNSLASAVRTRTVADANTAKDGLIEANRIAEVRLEHGLSETKTNALEIDRIDSLRTKENAENSAQYQTGIAEAQKTYSVAIATASKTYFIEKYDQVGGFAVHRKVANAQATRNRSISVATEKRDWILDENIDRKTVTDDLASEAKRYGDALAALDLQAATDEASNVLAQHVSLLAADKAYRDLEIGFSNSLRDSIATADKTLALAEAVSEQPTVQSLATSLPLPFTQFLVSVASAISSWTTGLQSKYDALASSRNSSDKTYHDALTAAYVLRESAQAVSKKTMAVETAGTAKNAVNSRSESVEKYIKQVSPIAKTYADKMAETQRDYDIALAWAQYALDAPEASDIPNTLKTAEQAAIDRDKSAKANEDKFAESESAVQATKVRELATGSKLLVENIADAELTQRTTYENAEYTYKEKEDSLFATQSNDWAKSEKDYRVGETLLLVGAYIAKAWTSPWGILQVASAAAYAAANSDFFTDSIDMQTTASQKQASAETAAALSEKNRQIGGQKALRDKAVAEALRDYNSSIETASEIEESQKTGKYKVNLPAISEAPDILERYEIERSVEDPYQEDVEQALPTRRHAIDYGMLGWSRNWREVIDGNLIGVLAKPRYLRTFNVPMDKPKDFFEKSYWDTTDASKAILESDGTALYYKYDIGAEENINNSNAIASKRPDGATQDSQASNTMNLGSGLANATGNSNWIVSEGETSPPVARTEPPVSDGALRKSDSHQVGALLSFENNELGERFTAQGSLTTIFVPPRPEMVKMLKEQVQKDLSTLKADSDLLTTNRVGSPMLFANESEKRSYRDEFFSSFTVSAQAKATDDSYRTAKNLEVSMPKSLEKTNESRELNIKSPMSIEDGDSNLQWFGRDRSSYDNKAELPNLGALTKEQFEMAISGHVVSESRNYGTLQPEYRVYAVPFQTSDGDDFTAIFESTVTPKGFRTPTYHYSYRLAGVAPGSLNLQTGIEVLSTDKIDLQVAKGSAAALESLLHIIPVGAASDYVSREEYGNAGLSILGDAALGLGAIAKIGTISVRMSKIAGASAAGIEGSLGVYRTAEGILLMQRGEGGYGQLAEGIFRLVGAKVSLAKAPVSGGARFTRGIEGLRDAENFVPGRLQCRGNTCGLYAADSALGNLGAGKLRIPEAYRQILRTNPGLKDVELRNLIMEMSDDLAAIVKTGWKEADLFQSLTRGSVIAHVDGNHWVHVITAYSRNGKTYVKVYDSGRGGFYEQLLDSFYSRTTSTSPLILIVK